MLALHEDAPSKDLVLPECPAPLHNTPMADRGRVPKSQGGGAAPRCICPRSEWLRRRRLKAANDYAHDRRERRVPAWFKGPWRLADECTARVHWTVRAARGKYGVRCVCPRAVAVFAKEREAFERLTGQRAPSVSSLSTTLPEMRPTSVRFVKMPDLSRGACMRPENAKKMELGHNRAVSTLGILHREQAKSVCAECPFETARACGSWAAENESPRGSWSGIYGGRDPWERSGRRLIVRNGNIEAVPFRIGDSLDDFA